MQLTQAQFEQIEQVLPVQRGNVSITNLDVLNAIIYVMENGCKWRSLPKSFGVWHTIYTRMNRWSKKGVLDNVFEHLQRERILNFDVRVVSLDSTSIKVHPDAAGVLKKRGRKPLARLAEERQSRFIWLPRLLLPL